MNKTKQQIQQRIKDDATAIMRMGYNKQQATSIAWAEYFDEREAIIEARYQGNFDAGYTYDCYCFDCKKGNEFKAASSIRLFINEHKNHKTKTFRR